MYKQNNLNCLLHTYIDQIGLKFKGLYEYQELGISTYTILIQYFRRLKHLVNTRKDDWDIYIPSVIFSINTSVQATTKHTPFEIMFGRNCRKGSEISSDNVVRIFV